MTEHEVKLRKERFNMTDAQARMKPGWSVARNRGEGGVWIESLELRDKTGQVRRRKHMPEPDGVEDCCWGCCWMVEEENCRKVYALNYLGMKLEDFSDGTALPLLNVVFYLCEECFQKWGGEEIPVLTEASEVPPASLEPHMET